MYCMEVVPVLRGPMWTSSLRLLCITRSVAATRPPCTANWPGGLFGSAGDSLRCHCRRPVGRLSSESTTRRRRVDRSEELIHTVMAPVEGGRRLGMGMTPPGRRTGILEGDISELEKDIFELP